MGGGNEGGDPNQHSGDGDDGRNHKEIAEGGFFASIQARLVVEQVVEGVRGAATFSFDYLCLVIVASMLAAVGLASNNTVVIVASMLVSPIMGPILAITFGTMIENNELVHMGLVNEVVSLVICILVGFVTAWIFIACDAHNEWIWPTNEMGGRGTSVGILTGIAIATPSGVGVALSILSNNTSSLVGVAISASLLPPAVNAGMMWAYAIFCAFSDSHVEYMDSKHYVGLLTNETSARVSAIPMNSSEISWAGLISLLLTLLNIAIILVTACAMFYFKSVVKYEGEGAEWSNEFKKYKAANYVVKNDGKGRLFAEKAKWVAKLGGGHAKGVKNSQFSAPGGRRSCSTCCQGSGVQDPSPGASLQMTGNPGGSGKKKHVTGRRISMPLGNPGMTGIGPGFGAQEQPHAHNNLTPKTGARPDALSLFGAPAINFTSSPAEKPADVHAQALAAGVVEGHKTLNRLMSQSILNRSGDPSATGGRPGGLRSTSSMAMSPSRTMGGSRTPIAMRPEQITLNHINTPKSLFKGRRARHAEQKVALSQTMATVHAMRRSSGAHTRAISHSQYGNMAMAGFFDAPDDSRFEA